MTMDEFEKLLALSKFERMGPWVATTYIDSLRAGLRESLAEIIRLKADDPLNALIAWRECEKECAELRAEVERLKQPPHTYQCRDCDEAVEVVAVRCETCSDKHPSNEIVRLRTALAEACNVADEWLPDPSSCDGGPRAADDAEKIDELRKLVTP